MQGTQPDIKRHENMEADWHFQENEPNPNRLLPLLWYHGQWTKFAEDETQDWKSTVLLAEPQKPEKELQLGRIPRIVKSIPLSETENICKYLSEWLDVEQLALQRYECGKAARSVLRGVRLARGVSTQLFCGGTVTLRLHRNLRAGIWERRALPMLTMEGLIAVISLCLTAFGLGYAIGSKDNNKPQK